MGVQMFVCPSVGMWRAYANPYPCTNLDEILHAHPHLSQERFWFRFDPCPAPHGPWGSKILKAEEDIFENCLLNKICLEGCKITWAAPGTSASWYYKRAIYKRLFFTEN